MKLDSSSVLCVSLILFHAHSSLAKKGGGGFGRGFGSKKFSAWNRGSTGHKSKQGSRSKGGYPKQPGQNHQGGPPPHSGRSYPRQPAGGGYHQYPVQGSAYGKGNGGYPGGYINQNPNNKILSPHYGGSIGYGGYGVRGGSPFSHSVQATGMYPQDKSRGFGRSAAMAAAGGAMAGMALGYGLGRFPRPHFNFHCSQEEHYYNHYMYRRYGTKSTDTDDYGRDYTYSQADETYDSFMDSCEKRTDVLPVPHPKPNSEAAATAADMTPSPDADAAESNSAAAEDLTSPSPSTPHSPNQPEDSPVPPTPQQVSDEEDDDTVSIMEIDYPALVKQMKARRCLELYMVYSEKFLMRQTGGVHGLKMGLQGFLAVVPSIIVMLLNSNTHVLLH